MNEEEEVFHFLAGVFSGKDFEVFKRFSCLGQVTGKKVLRGRNRERDLELPSAVTIVVYYDL